MTDRVNSDLAALLTPPPSQGVQFTQARVLSWDTETLRNTLEWRGITLRDVSLVEGINALTIRENDIVGMLGWAPENAKGVGSWWIVGKLSTPGEFISDFSVTARIFRFVNFEGNTLMFLGSEGDGDPLWMLFYGGADEVPVMRIVNGQELFVSYRDGSIAATITGTPGDQIFRIFDQQGNEIFGGDGASGLGLARPWIPYLMTPTHDAEINGPTYTPSTTSASYVDLWRGFNPVFHPRVSFGLVTFGAAREWRLRANAGAGFTTVASGTSSVAGEFGIPGWGSGTNPGDEVEFVLQARVTSGGAAHLTIDKFYGRQS